MELLLALAVITAVIIFGALISLGNERQRRAIDGLRDQVVLWAIQDLRIKRERLAHEVRVDNPLKWLNTITTRIVGYDLCIKVVETFEDPQVLVCESTNSNAKIFFTPLSPHEIKAWKRPGKSLLSKPAVQNPLLSVGRRSNKFELTPVNAGFLFDVELSIAWRSLMKQDLGRESIWMYIV